MKPRVFYMSVSYINGGIWHSVALYNDALLALCVHLLRKWQRQEGEQGATKRYESIKNVSNKESIYIYLQQRVTTAWRNQ